MKIYWVLLLIVVALLITTAVHAADAVAGCIREDSGTQFDLGTKQVSYAPNRIEPFAADDIQKAENGLWKLNVRGDGVTTIFLHLKPDDSVVDAGLSSHKNPAYAYAAIQHGDKTGHLEIYALYRLKRVILISGLFAGPVAWNEIAQRAAFIGRDTPEAAPRLLLVALDTGVTRSFDMAAIAGNSELLRAFPLEPAIETKWSPDGKYLTYVAPMYESVLQVVNLFGMDGSYRLDIDHLTRKVDGIPTYPVVIWAKDSKRFYYTRQATSLETACEEQECYLLWMAYRLDNRQTQPIVQLLRSVLESDFNEDRTRAMISWIDSDGRHTGVIDLRTDQKTALIGKGSVGLDVHWTDHGLTWVEDFDRPDYRIIWMANETAKRFEAIFKGEKIDFEYPGVGGDHTRPQVIWKQQSLVLLLQSGPYEERLFSTWLIDLKTGKTERFAQTPYRTRVIPSPDDTMLVLFPKWFSDGDSKQKEIGITKIIFRDRAKSDIDLKIMPPPSWMAWSPDSTMLAYRPSDNFDLLKIIDKEGNLLVEYKMSLPDDFQWLPACLPPLYTY